MKTITPYLLKFAVAATFLTIVFRYFLSYGIDNKSAIIIALSAVFYGIAMFISGWYFGRKDGEYLPIYDVGFRFHACTYLVHNLISVLWFTFNFNSSYEQLQIIYITALLWGVLLIIHLLFYLYARKNSINNLYKKDLFD